MKTLVGLKGTPGYWAPELARGDAVTHLSDVFSIGIVLWELIHRVIVGKYGEPYSEYGWFDKRNPALHMVLTLKMSPDGGGVRPTLPKNTPQVLVDM
jgi:serine/threonine protein kinase